MSSFVGNTWDICDDGVGQVAPTWIEAENFRTRTCLRREQSGEILQKMLTVIFYVIIIRFLGLKSVLLKENSGIRTLMPGVWPTASSTHQLAPTIFANACKFISKIFLRLYLNLH